MTENQNKENEIELEEIPLEASEDDIEPPKTKNTYNKKISDNMKKYIFIGLSIIGLLASAVIIGVTL